MNIKLAGSGALHDSHDATRRLKTAKPQAGHLNLDESVIEVEVSGGAVEHVTQSRTLPDTGRSRPTGLGRQRPSRHSTCQVDSGGYFSTKTLEGADFIEAVLLIVTLPTEGRNPVG